MALNKREKLIAWTLGVAVVLFVGDYYVVEPYFQTMSDISTKQVATDKSLATAKGLLDNRKKVDEAWKALMAKGLMSTAADAGLGTQHAVTDWAQASLVKIENYKTDAPAQFPDFQQVKIAITANGTMAELSRFLYCIETGPLPLQVGEVRISSHKDGTDDLGMQFTVTSLVFAPQETTTKPRRTTPTGGNS